MRVGLLLTALLLARSLVAQSGWQAAPPVPTFETGTTLVRVDFSVLKDLIPLDGVRREHLRLLDNGKPQEIRNISYGDLPLDLVLVFDVSGSMRPAVEDVSRTAELAMKELRPGDRAAVFSFDNNTRLLLRLTSDLDGVVACVHRQVLEMPFSGGTRLLAAVDDVAKYLLRERKSESRRALVVITDDEGVRTRRESTVADRLWEADASLNGLIVTSGMRTFFKWYSRITAPHVEFTMRQGIGGVAEKTGGVLIKVKDAGAAFPELIRHLRSRPTIFYPMPAAQPGERRKITLDLSDEGRKQFPGARIYARQGYRVPVPGEVQ